MKEPVSIKGTREGLTITLGASEWSQVVEDLSRHLQMQGAFFRGGRVALEAGERAIEQEQLTQIQQLLQQHDMILRTIVTSNELTQDSSQKLGLRLVVVAEQLMEPEAIAPVVEVKPRHSSGLLEGSKGVLIRHLVRSGQVLRHTGHIVIVGDVNLGGEVIAGGDIVIWGRLLGLAHAGSMGDESAVICALQMTPMQVRIAKLVGRADESDRDQTDVPEIAYVRDNVIVVEPWNKAPRGMR